MYTPNAEKVIFSIGYQEDGGSTLPGDEITQLELRVEGVAEPILAPIRSDHHSSEGVHKLEFAQKGKSLFPKMKLKPANFNGISLVVHRGAKQQKMALEVPEIVPGNKYQLSVKVNKVGVSAGIVKMSAILRE